MAKVPGPVSENAAPGSPSNGDASSSAAPAPAEKKKSRLETVLHYLTLGLEGAPSAGEEGGGFASRVDGAREVVETIVFVVVLVLLLKSFVAEAFVIPTGSMAETLFGYQKIITCPKCERLFPVNCSQEVDPQDGRDRVPVKQCTCPNCRWTITDMGRTEVVVERNADGTPRWDERFVPKHPSHTGDRVLVAKFLYDLPHRWPERLDVVVFKYPMEPQRNYTAMNYIKRLVGLGGETIAIWDGNLYVLPKDKGPKYDDSHVPPEDLWRKEHMHQDDPAVLQKFLQGDGFAVVTKPPPVMLAMRRIVYDNEHPAKDLKDQPRWYAADDAWTTKDQRTFGHDARAGGLAWLRYRHLLRGGKGRPELITDFMGYNTGQGDLPNEYWVGDLMLEADVTVAKADGPVVLELSRGADRFRAVFNSATGECVLRRVVNNLDGSAPADDAGAKLASAQTAFKGPGTYKLRFANFDERLTVWVNSTLPFGEGVSYPRTDHPGPYPNDLQPASIGVTGAGVSVTGLRLWRDTYYTPPPRYDHRGEPRFTAWDEPEQWKELRGVVPHTFYVQPGHYLCMGDNSPQSSDGRTWGAVPERLMLGRALVVYYPFYFPWWPLEAPVNRVGPIR